MPQLQNLWPSNFRDSHLRIGTCLLINAAIALSVLDCVAKQNCIGGYKYKKSDIFRDVPAVSVCSWKENCNQGEVGLPR